MDLDSSGTAARAGLQAGDVILQVNRKKVESAAEARTELQKIKSGGTTMLLIWRRNQEIFVTLKKD
jgi:serine protease Do